MSQPKSKGTFIHGQLECKLVQPRRKSGGVFFEKLKIGLPCEQLHCTQAFTRRMSNQRVLEMLTHQHSLHHYTGVTEPTWANREMNKESVAHIHSVFFSAIKESKVMPLTKTRVPPEVSQASKWRQFWKDSYQVLALMWFLDPMLIYKITYVHMTWH